MNLFLEFDHRDNVGVLYAGSQQVPFKSASELWDALQTAALRMREHGTASPARVMAHRYVDPAEVMQAWGSAALPRNVEPKKYDARGKQTNVKLSDLSIDLKFPEAPGPGATKE